MSKPIIQIGTEVREMTETEYSEWLSLREDVAAFKEQQQQIRDSRTSALSKLAALGLTEAEINALLGAS